MKLAHPICVVGCLGIALALLASSGCERLGTHYPTATTEEIEAKMIEQVKNSKVEAKLKRGQSIAVKAGRTVVTVAKDESGEVSYRARPVQADDGL